MKKRLSRFASCLIAFAMMISMLQITAFAAEDPLGDLTVPAGETITITENDVVNEVVLDGTVTADHPVVIFYNSSDDVTNGQVINNVQFVCEYDEVVAMVHTNDVHGYIEVEPYVKGLADSLKDSGEYSLVLTISAGDVYGAGAAVAGSYDGEFIPAIMDKVYDIVVPGNNDYGSAGVVMQNLLLSALYEKTVTLCANLTAIEAGLPLADYAAGYTSKVGNELFAELYPAAKLGADGSLDLSALELQDVPGGENPYRATITYTTSNGTVVGLYGITTNGGACATQADPQGSINSAQISVNTLQAEGADVIVGVVHTGWMGEGSAETSSNDTNTWQMATRMTGQAALIDSHTHSVINGGEGILVNGTFINQAVCFGSCIGVMEFYINDGLVVAIDGQNITDMSGIVPSAQVQKLVDQALAKTDADFGGALAETEYFLNGERLSAGNEGGSVRGNETNLGDLMTDVILAAASEKTGVNYDFVHYPGYWLRASIEAGEITQEDIQAVFSNPTALEPVEYTAAQVVSMVEKGLSSVYPEKEGTTFNHYSGITVTYTNAGGKGTPVTISVGDTLIYDANKGGVQVGSDWTCKGIFTLTGGEIDNYTGSKDHWLCADKTEVQVLVADWLASHEQGVDYVIYPNTVAPAGRIVEVTGTDVPDVPDEPDVPAISNPFSDVAESDYFYAPVLWAVQNNITTGVSEISFAPNATCTRAQVVTFLWRANGEPEPSSGNNPFVDVKETDYFYKAVLWAVEKGITTGLDANHFGPESSCTRGQVATFLWRAKGESEPASANPFTDVKNGDYYYKAVLWAVENGITKGVSEGKFGPGDACTRGQIVTFLQRADAVAEEAPAPAPDGGEGGEPPAMPEGGEGGTPPAPPSGGEGGTPPAPPAGGEEGGPGGEGPGMPEGTTYILNLQSMKFHDVDCGTGQNADHISYTNCTRDEVLAMGYSPCGNCDP